MRDGSLKRVFTFRCLAFRIQLYAVRTDHDFKSVANRGGRRHDAPNIAEWHLDDPVGTASGNTSNNDVAAANKFGGKG